MSVAPDTNAGATVGGGDLHQAAKIEALIQIGGAVAHELNNALTGILGNLQSLSDRTKGWSDAPAHVEMALDQAKRGVARLATLAGSLQAATGRQRLNPQRIPIGDFLAAFVPRCTESSDRSIQLEISAADCVWDVAVDPQQLEIAIRNLVTNAMEAMPSGGKLAIAARNETFAGSAAPNHPAGAGDFVVLAVVDSGAGMTDRVSRRAAELFFTTKPADKGLGLGLCQVHSFAKRSGGGVQITSNIGKGTRVELYLPRSTVSTVEGDVPASTLGRNRATVLVVEDDDIVCDYILEALQDLNYGVVTAQNAQKALRYLELAHSRFDLMLTDVNLPGMDGHELTRQVTKRYPDICVLVMSGSQGEGFPEKPGVHIDFIAKPMTQAGLDEHIGRLLAQRRKSGDSIVQERTTSDS